MRFGLRRIVSACLVAAGAVAVLVPGGSAGNRTADVTFEAFPGPGQVTYGENIAYQATFTNTSGSNFTHVVFRMRVPYVDLDTSVAGLDAEAATPPAYAPVFSNCATYGGQAKTVALSTGGHEWQCDLGNLGPGTAGQVPPQVTLTVVWQAPTLPQAADCPNCLKTNGRFTTKEGTNDVSDPNDAFYPVGGGPDVLTSATLLSGDVPGSTNRSSAGGYEFGGCANPLGAGSLHTNGTLDASQNKVQTIVCVPSLAGIATTTYPGLATTILEGVPHPFNPGHSYLETADVCIAALGSNCGPFGQYTPQVFAADHPITLVFRVPDDALNKGDTITNVWHNYDPLTNPDPLPLCTPTGPVPLNGCLDGQPTLSKGKDKVWTIIVKSRTNGWHTW